MKDRQLLFPPGANDEVLTPDYAVRALIPHLARSIQTVWCPFDREDSQFVIQLRQAGFHVIHSHIDAGQDFFSWEPSEPWDAIVSNNSVAKAS